jgi:hypothetical protein
MDFDSQGREPIDNFRPDGDGRCTSWNAKVQYGMISPACSGCMHRPLYTHRCLVEERRQRQGK